MLAMLVLDVARILTRLCPNATPFMTAAHFKENRPRYERSRATNTKRPSPGSLATGACANRHLLPGFAGESGFVQRGKHFLVVEVAGHFKRFGSLHRSVAFHAGDGLERAVHGLDALAATQVHAVHLKRLDLLALGAGVVVDLDFGVAAFPEV